VLYTTTFTAVVFENVYLVLLRADSHLGISRPRKQKNTTIKSNLSHE
jgi:hypothetical protein